VSDQQDQAAESLRSRMRAALGDAPEADALLEILRDAAKPNRPVRLTGFDCEKCDWHCPHHHMIHVPDPKAAMAVIEFFLNQTEGRPGVADGEEASVIIKRIVVGLDE